jgi:hypothetical protein
LKAIRDLRRGGKLADRFRQPGHDDRRSDEMSTAEMSMTTNTARALIDARLEAVERALIGRLSRSERLDIVGEVESRIDELLRERCGSGIEPTREDVLAVLARLDPPEAYLDFESGEETRQPSFERAMNRPGSATFVNDDKLKRRSLYGGICGIVGVVFALISPGFILLSVNTNSAFFLYFGFGGCVFTCMTMGAAAIVLSAMGELRSGWSIAGLVLGVISALLSLIGLFLMMLG